MNRKNLILMQYDFNEILNLFFLFQVFSLLTIFYFYHTCVNFKIHNSIHLDFFNHSCNLKNYPSNLFHLNLEIQEFFQVHLKNIHFAKYFYNHNLEFIFYYLFLHLFS